LFFATQNPVDVDYKALSNAGTWMIGRLQTDQDKQRLLDGLESAAGGVARSEYDRIISALPKRVFLYQNVHSKAPLIFQSRWAMDYLAGPLTLNQIPALNQLAGVAPFSGKSQKLSEVVGTASVGSRANPATSTLAFTGKPDLPAEIQEYFLSAQNAGNQSVYRPALIAQADVNYYSRTPNVNFTRTYAVQISNPGTGSLDWESGKIDPMNLKSLSQGPVTNSRFDPLPGHLRDAKWWNSRSAQFEEWIYETQAAIVYVHKKLGIVSDEQESLDHFKERCRQAMVQNAPSGNTVFDKKRTDLQRKIESQQAKVNQYQSDVTHYTLDEGGHVLGTVINIFMRGRTTGASSTINANRRRAAAQNKLDEAKSALASLQQQLAGLQGDSQPGQNLLQNDIQEIKIAPSKRDIVIKAFGLAWMN
jgi:hypothetical protein